MVILLISISVYVFVFCIGCILLEYKNKDSAKNGYFITAAFVGSFFGIILFVIVFLNAMKAGAFLN